MTDMLQPLPGPNDQTATVPGCEIPSLAVWLPPVDAREEPYPDVPSRGPASGASATPIELPKCVRELGLSLSCLTLEETLDQIDALVDRRQPSYFITANLHYAMLSQRDPRLAEVNRNAAFLVADGMPLVWYSRLKWRRLPERVAGADLIYSIAERAAVRRYRMFLLGGAPGVAQQAADNLQDLYGPLDIAGIEAPDLDQLSADQHQQLVARIRKTRADLLLVALGQPKGELWLAEHCQALGVPVCVQLGASFDFVAGRVPRAPRWMQETGTEWLYRVWCEPRRMLPRYYRDAKFLLGMFLRDLFGTSGHRSSDQG